MQSFMGLGYRISKNPHWFNATSGEVVQTPGEHHSSVFARDPGVLGLSPDDIAFKCSGEAYAIAYANQMLENGWCRIDIGNDHDRVLGATPLGRGAVAINAPNIDAANAAIKQVGYLTEGRATRIVLVITPRATKTLEGQTFDLSGAELASAIVNGIERATPKNSSVDRDDIASKSKMRPAARRCPFGGRA